MQDINISLALNINLGSGPAATAYGEAVENFRGASVSSSFGVLTTCASTAGCALKSDFFAAQCALAQRIANVSGVVVPSMHGISFDSSHGHVQCRDFSKAMEELREPKAGAVYRFDSLCARISTCTAFPWHPYLIYVCLCACIHVI